MKAYEIQTYSGSDGLRLVDRPLPEPADYEVLVRIKAASLNHSKKERRSLRGVDCLAIINCPRLPDSGRNSSATWVLRHAFCAALV